MEVKRPWLVLALACSACGQVEEPSCGPALSGACEDVPRHVAQPRDECEGLDPDECLLPWPSSRFLVADATTGTGWRVQLPEGAMPVNGEGVPVSPEAWNRWDGFSGSTSMMVQLDGPVDASTLPSWRDPGASLAPDSPTIVLDADTGARIAHFAELEPATEAEPRVTLYIRPAARLPDDTRIVVAVRDLSGADGCAVHASEAFAALRDGCATDSPSLEARRASFEEAVLAPLERASIPRDELIAAWDFHTASGPSAWGDLRAMRDVAVAALDAGTLGCVIDDDTEVEHEGETFRRVEGHIDVPLFLASLERGARLSRDAEGAPIAAATTRVPFFATWPTSIESGTGAATMLYGHGLFTSRLELDQDFGHQLLARGGMVGIATDLIGLNDLEYDRAGAALVELSGFSVIIDRVTQGIVAMLVLPRLFATGCAELLGIEGALDPSALVYAGNSQGAIVGPTIAALSPDVERYALGVGGIGYSVMMPRSVGFEAVEQVLELSYARRVDRDLLMVMFQHHWDRFEGAAFAPHVDGDRLAGSIERPARVLYQIGLEDTGTPNVSSEIAARTLGLGALSSSASQPWGTAPAGDAPQSAYVAFDYDAVPLSDAPVRPSADNGVHERVRRDPVAQAQIVRFFGEGLIAP